MIAKLDREDNAVISEKNNKNARDSAAHLLVNRLSPAPQAKAPKVIQNQLSVMQ